jgi:hypothetical protein
MVTRGRPAHLILDADRVGSQSPGRLRPGDLNLVDYNTCHVLSCMRSLVVVLDKVIWNLWEVFKRSCGLPTRSFGPTVRSAEQAAWLV